MSGRLSDRTSRQIVLDIEELIYIGFVIFITNLLIRLIDTIVKHSMERHAGKTSSTVDLTLLVTLNRIVTILVLIVALVITLGHFGVDVSSLLVFLGGGSVAVALAAQETLSNMMAGFVIMIDKPFRVGNRIKLSTGETGDVFDIGLRSTKLLDQDHNVIILPNAELTKGRVVNLSYPTSEARALIEIDVAYGTDIPLARSIMLRAAREHGGILASPAPETYFVDLKESSCRLQLSVRVADGRTKGTIEDALRQRIYTDFQKTGIIPGYPRRIVHIAPKMPDDNSKNS